MFDNISFSIGSHADDKKYIKEICEKYPYFSLAHFYSARNNQVTSSPEVQMALLHFNNAALFNYRFNYKKDEVIHEDFNEQQEKVEHEDEKIPHEEVKQEIVQQEEVKEHEILFEPLHTTDYFASQGIKISDEIQPNDKLGKQLRSFTDWLKTMKKLEGSTVTDPSVDISIQKIAENSNIDSETITESMAEIFIKQGKTAKAREIYKKLSLQNPDKSAYFASKLEFLNQK